MEKKKWKKKIKEKRKKGEKRKKNKTKKKKKKKSVNGSTVFCLFCVTIDVTSVIYEYRQAKRDLRDVESLRQNCGLFDVIEIAVPRKKSTGIPRYFPEFNNA